MPVPPATVSAPVLMFELLTTLVIATRPLVLILPVMPTPPVTVSAPVVLLVELTLLLNFTRSLPATVTLKVVALGQ